MLYYMVPDCLDNARITRNKNYFLVATELYTEKECIKLGIPIEKLTQVNISRKSIYWFFGCRFSKVQHELNFRK